jgi:hypothetical protein
MSVIALTPRNFDVSTLETHPSRSFSTGSHGVTGSVYVYAQRSPIEKDAEFLNENQKTAFGESVLINALDALKVANETLSLIPNANALDIVDGYMNLVRMLPSSRRKQQQVSISHFRSAPTLTTASLAKNFVRKTLAYNYKHQYPGMNWAYTNFNCLNFFTSSLNHAHGYNDDALATGVPTNGTALIYPASTSSFLSVDGINATDTIKSQIVTNKSFLYTPYRPRNGFTFEFWINPRYNKLDDQGEFPAGTIMHMSSCYAISLVTGSQRDLQNNPSDFKIMLQLSHSADVAPRDVTLLQPLGVDTGMTAGTPVPNNYDVREVAGIVNYRANRPGWRKDMIFVSSASLYHNHWHHVAIRWSPTQQGKEGHFIIDGKVDATGRFSIPSASIMPAYFPSALPSGEGTVSDPDALFIGNYYEGRNAAANDSEIALFFNNNSSPAFGLPTLRPDKTISPTNFSFQHDLQAEVHELRIWQYGIDPDLIAKRSQTTLNYNMIQNFSSKGIHYGGQIAAAAAGTGKIFNPDLSVHTLEVDGVQYTGLPPLKPKQKLMFYLPVAFVKETPKREVAWTPFYKCNPAATTIYDESGAEISTIAATNYEDTVTPFNVKLAFTTNCLQINLPNFLRDFANKKYPRLYNLTASLVPDKLSATFTNNTAIIATDGFGTELESPADYGAKTSLLGYGTAGKEKIAKANSLIMPCDNGLFRPYFPMLVSGTDSIIGALQGSDSLDLVQFDKANPFLDYKADVFSPKSGSLLDKFVSDKGILDFSLITLNDMIYQGELEPSEDGTPPDPMWTMDKMAAIDPANAYYQSSATSNLGDAVMGATPYWPALFPNGLKAISTSNLPEGVDPDSVAKLGAITAVGTGLMDNSSNMVSFFNVSNLYYGDRIQPGSLTIRGILGLVKSEESSDFKAPLSMVLRDNGDGNLYRADSKTPHAKWNSVGNVFYDDGLIAIKSPHIYTFGFNAAQISDLRTPGLKAYEEDGVELGTVIVAGDQAVASHEAYSIEFQGDRNVHVLEMMIPAPAGMFNSSSNPRYQKLLPSDNINDKNSQFVYITGLNFHDNNFNIIARTNLAQPVMKRDQDKLFFRVKIDF